MNETSGNANLPIGGLGLARKGATQESGVPGGVPGGVPEWHSRGYLPHFESAEAIQHVTFHLADSLPKEVLDRLSDELKGVSAAKRDVERRKRIEAWMDSGYGSCILREPSLAAMVVSTLLHFDSVRYRVIAWVVMPNHVHVLFEPIEPWTVAKVVASWKKFTARKIKDYLKSAGNAPGNATLLSGRVWHREYWDRYIRNEQHFYQAVEYIHQNPVKAGLIEAACDWPWSSAWGDANQEIGVPGSV